MNLRRLAAPFALALLLGLAILGSVLTREAKPDEGLEPSAPARAQERETAAAKGKSPAPRRERRVDTRSLQTARNLAALAETKEEQAFARQAERLADHAVDLAFADALRQAVENPPPLTPEQKELLRIQEERERALARDQSCLQQLQARLAQAPEGERERLQDQMEVLKAELELGQDELLEAREDLEQAGGDPQAKIRRLKEAYDAAQKEPRPLPPPLEGATRVGSLLARLRVWRAQSRKLALLRTAQQDARDRVQRMTDRRAKAVARIKEASEAKEQARSRASSVTQGQPSAASRQAAIEAIEALKKVAIDQRRVTELGRRIQDYQALSEVYQTWAEKVEALKRAALHQVFRGLLWVLGTLLGAVLLGSIVEALFSRFFSRDPGHRTLLNVAKLAVQIAGVLAVVFIILGTPAQLTTILGLAGAGLTVALKDFIVAFFGWFILLGRNGIRVGDWVEIRGVGGEVVEIGPLHTVVLETGSWSDAGHPTGRRVSFVNNFAIEGHYFNFSTSGQWMWDELQVLIPHGRDPYPVLDGVQKLVEEATQANTQIAGEEWRKATTRYRVKTFTAVPGIHLSPTKDGVELRVRYITRAYERHETRKRLYRDVVALMVGPREEAK